MRPPIVYLAAIAVNVFYPLPWLAQTKTAAACARHDPTKAGNAGVREPRSLGSDGETSQPAATGVHNMAGMGQSHSEATSNSNSLAALHSGLEGAYEARGVP